MPDNNILILPEIEKKDYERNFIRLAVCEFRFPTLLELETKEPVKFQMSVRKEYPHYSRGKNISIQPGSENPEKETVYTFLSKKKDWTIGLKPSSISLETGTYGNFTEFSERLTNMLDKAKSIIDTNFFTRVGLRYIDILPVKDDSLKDWINPELTNPLIRGEHGKPDNYWQEISGNCTAGKYIFRHGIRNNNYEEYILDFDYYDENIELSDIKNKVNNLHHESVKLFFWALGKKGKAYMNAKA